MAGVVVEIRVKNGAEVKKLSASEPLSQGPAWSEMVLSIPNLGARSGVLGFAFATSKGVTSTKL